MSATSANILGTKTQWLWDVADPTAIKPILDRVILEDVPDAEQEGLIFIPRNAAERGVGNRGRLRIGIVRAVGPGDKWIEDWDDIREVPKRRGLADGVDHLPMEVKVGDRVIFDVRREALFIIGGKKYYLVHAEQSILGIMETSDNAA